MAKVLIGSPNHDGRMDADGAAALYCLPSNQRHECHAVNKTSSLLTLNCNVLWCHALNARADGFTWFAMLHSDIRPDNYWVDTLIDEAEKYGADMVSACVPIKDSRGLTSTGLFGRDNPWLPRFRLTLSQVHNVLPETFDRDMVIDAIDPNLHCAGNTSDDQPWLTLDVNTGCCVVRLDRDWGDLGVWFENHDRIVLKDGKWIPETQSEDWVFSRKISNAGGKVMATRRVRCWHNGTGTWRSDKVWGQETDEDVLKPKEQEPCLT